MVTCARYTYRGKTLMAAKPSATIIGEIEDHITANGGEYSEWYVGVTDSPKHALYRVHGLRPSGDACISRRAQDDLRALAVAEYFHTVLRTRGTRSKTSLDHVFVYAYRIKPHTRQ
jgi:hypothetical protein